jgi:hypothetical protein
VQQLRNYQLDSVGYKKAKEFLEQRYGDPSEVVNAHIQEIMSLPIITGISRPKIHNFYDNLLGHVQALETLGKLEQVAGNVRMTLDKLVGIRADLIRTEKDWKKWTFTELDHRSVECTKVVDVGERKRIPSIKRRCFNCTGEKHRARECKSNTQCYKCQRKHHTSICDKAEPSPTMCQQTNPT